MLMLKLWCDGKTSTSPLFVYSKRIFQRAKTISRQSFLSSSSTWMQSKFVAQTRFCGLVVGSTHESMYSNPIHGRLAVLAKTLQILSEWSVKLTLTSKCTITETEVLSHLLHLQTTELVENTSKSLYVLILVSYIKERFSRIDSCLHFYFRKSSFYFMCGKSLEFECIVTGIYFDTEDDLGAYAWLSQAASIIQFDSAGALDIIGDYERTIDGRSHPRGETKQPNYSESIWAIMLRYQHAELRECTSNTGKSISETF